MHFIETNYSCVDPDVLVSGERLQIAKEFKYLGILLHSNLNFRAPFKKSVNGVKLSLANFRFIRNSMSTEAAKVYMHSVSFSHMNYCLTSWSQAKPTTLKPLQSLYKQTLKTLDKKPKQFHHCAILKINTIYI